MQNIVSMFETSSTKSSKTLPFISGNSISFEGGITKRKGSSIMLVNYSIMQNKQKVSRFVIAKHNPICNSKHMK